MKASLLSRLLARRPPILADGAMGTMLHAHGVSFDSCFDELNLSRPDLVLRIHRQYLQAGADLLETNTFGANRFKLGHHGLASRVAEVNAAAVALARRAARDAGRDILIAGSIGPLGVRLAPTGRVAREQASATYQEQAAALILAGVDLLVIETQIDPEEAVLAIQAARRAGEVPVAASLTFTRELYPGNGGRPEHSLGALVEAGAAIVGANCSQGPEQLSQIHGAFARVIGRTPVSLMPNAGWPEEAAGRIKYPASPIYFAEFAEAMSARKSVRILGGCCGTTPDHIAAMRQAIDHPRRNTHRVQSPAVSRRPAAARRPAPRRRSSDRMPTSLAAGLAGGRFPLCVEFSPPHGFLTDRTMASIRRYQQAGADVINVADSPLARMRMSPWAVCHRIQNELGIETVLHFPTRGRNLLRVQGDLLAAHALGVRNVFVVMGDPPSVGDYPEAMGDFDLAPSGLIQLITRGFNAGADHAGAHLGGQTAFYVGCALDLGADDLPRELRVLHRKASAGAHFALTQPVFESEILDRFLAAYTDRYGPLALPILVGILPLLNERHARFLDNEVPGIRIPAGILQRLASSRAPRQTGLQIALETIQAVAHNAGGIYLIPPQADVELGIELLKAARRLAPGRRPAPGRIRRASQRSKEVRHDRKRSRRT